MNHPNYYYRKFKKRDLKYFDLLEEKQLVIDTADRLVELADSDNDHEFCGAVFWKNRPLYIGGYYELRDGVMKMFIIPDRNILEFPIAFHKSIIWWHRHIVTLSWVRSIYSMCLPIERIDKWMSSLGYVYGTTIPSYINGQDYKLWAKVG